MNLTEIHYGEVKKGKLVLDVPQGYLVSLSRLEGKKVELTIRKRRSERSLSQNRYYWGVVVAILADHFGMESEEMHEALKFKFLAKKTEKGLLTVRSTTSLSIDEFIDYINRIVRWAAMEYQCYIPDPRQIDLAA